MLIMPQLGPEHFGTLKYLLLEYFDFFLSLFLFLSVLLVKYLNIQLSLPPPLCNTKRPHTAIPFG